jgi:hypothetical protein
MVRIKDELEEIPVLLEIDFVDFKRVSKEFYDLAKSRMELIYKQ